MILQFKYGTTDIAFNVVFKNRRTMEIAVEPPDIITVTAPDNTSEDIIIDKVKGKTDWIMKKLLTFRNMEYRHINREFVNGESFMYLGRNYSLQIYIDENLNKPEVKLLHSKFYVISPAKDESIIRKAMEEWYRKKAKEKVEERIKYYEHYLNKKPADFKVKEQRKRWASCTSKDALLFNWRCVMAKSDVLDYIVVHEMCHMLYKNHSKEFWELVASILPDYEVRKEWLKNYGVRMDL